MSDIVCKCGQGYVSVYDNRCGHCRKGYKPEYDRRFNLFHSAQKLLIAGGRDFTDKAWVHSCVSELVSNDVLTDNCVLICGKARGADMTGHALFTEYGKDIFEYPANWNKHGNSAGYLRNVEMGHVTDVALIFWDGKSKGTKHMIDILRKANLQHLYVVNY